MNTKIITIKFQNHIRKDIIPFFRGAILHTLSSNEILFHNHIGNDKFRYSYPLVQYKALDGYAAIVCIDSGAEAIIAFVENFNSTARIGNKAVDLMIDYVKTENVRICISDTPVCYSLESWLPLNQGNHGRFTAIDNLREQCEMLESILAGNILSAGKGLGVYFEKHITCNISEIKRTYQVMYKGVRMTAFDILFTTDAILPDNIGLGKGVSLGNGTLKRHFKSKAENEMLRPSCCVNKKDSHNSILINYSNHPYATWSDMQKKAAEQYGMVKDLQFPAVEPSADETQIAIMAENAVNEITASCSGHISAVHIMGEMTLTFAVITRLKDMGIKCIASTTERISIDLGNGKKENRFEFRRFREY